MEQQGTVNNRTFVLLNFRSIVLACFGTYHISIPCTLYIDSSRFPQFRLFFISSVSASCRMDFKGFSSTDGGSRPQVLVTNGGAVKIGGVIE